MSNTLKFMKLDLYIIKPYFTVKVMLLLIFIIGITTFSTKDITFSTVFVMFFATIFTSYTFSVGETYSIDVLYEILPISKRNVVVGRYLFSNAMNVVFALLAVLIAMLISAIGIKGFETDGFVLTVFVGFFIFSLFQAIQLPIFFKFGYTKAKLLTYLPIVCIPVALLIFNGIVGIESLSPVLSKFAEWCMNNTMWVIVMYAVSWALIMFCSWGLSYKFYKKREF